MEFSVNEKQNPIFSLNNKGKYRNRITSANKKNIINFTKISKSNWNILKKKKELSTYKRQYLNSIKSKIFNLKKYYIYNVIYDKIFIILDIFILFFFISSSKQNSDLSNL